MPGSAIRQEIADITVAGTKGEALVKAIEKTAKPEVNKAK